MTGTLLAIAWRTKPREPMIEAQSASVSVERGVAEDFRGAPGARQVTVLFEDDWKAAAADLGSAPPWTTRRANFLVSGLVNPRRAGGRVRIGGVLLQITGETDPCSNMDRQVPGLTAALMPDWRGGLTARVIAGGDVRVGDAVVFEAESLQA
jgi:MOSC domain-containing protein YiiM